MVREVRDGLAGDSGEDAPGRSLRHWNAQLDVLASRLGRDSAVGGEHRDGHLGGFSVKVIR